MKRLTRLWGLLLALPLMMSGCDWLDNPVIPNLRVTKAALTLKVGETASCRATAQRHVALSYASANPAVATVDAAGMITAVSVGTTQITVKAEGEDDYYRTEIFGQTSTTIDVTVVPNPTNLASLTGDYTAHDGEVLTGTLTGSYKVSIADGATVELYNVTINGGDDAATQWAGITCLGDATITITGTNTVKGFYEEYPAIQPGPAGTTFTVNGTGSLTATGGRYTAGIGSVKYASCGDITINGGTINASSSSMGAGIGSGYHSSCGNITINGGTIIASSKEGAGIGSGYAYASCGAININGGAVTAGSIGGAGIGSGNGSMFTSITISAGITQVQATRNEESAWPIGKGQADTGSGAVTIDGATVTSRDWDGSGMTGLNFASSSTGGFNKTWTLTPAP